MPLFVAQKKAHALKRQNQRELFFGTTKVVSFRLVAIRGKMDSADD